MTHIDKPDPYFQQIISNWEEKHIPPKDVNRHSNLYTKSNDQSVNKAIEKWANAVTKKLHKVNTEKQR